MQQPQANQRGRGKGDRGRGRRGADQPIYLANEEIKSNPRKRRPDPIPQPMIQPMLQPIILGAKTPSDLLRTDDVGKSSSSATNPQSRSESKAQSNPTLKLINEYLNFQPDKVVGAMTDNSAFVVIGVIGGQGAGKSTIMSLLHGKQKKNQPAFNVQSKEHQLLSQHCTVGIDVAITPERIILLDTQAIFSSSTLFDLIKTEPPLLPECISYEHMHELQCLQIAIFLLSVCHVVIVAQDCSCLDWKLWHFLQTSFMLKNESQILPPSVQAHKYFFPPRDLHLITNNIIQQQRLRNQLDKVKSTLNLSDLYNPTHEYSPDIVFVFNRCPIELFSLRSQLQLRHTLDTFFQDYPFKRAVPLIQPSILEEHEAKCEKEKLKKLKEQRGLPINVRNPNEEKKEDIQNKTDSTQNQETSQEANETEEQDDPEKQKIRHKFNQTQNGEFHVSFYTLPLDHSYQLPGVDGIPLDIDLTASYQSSSETFRNNMLAAFCNLKRSKRFVNDNLTEKEWLRNAAQIWAVIRKSPLLYDYNKSVQTTNYKSSYHE